jgi:Ca2+-binding RTX toxin-like protein
VNGKNFLGKQLIFVNFEHDDWIIGNANDNQFYGNDGNDNLNGGEGNDQLDSGNGYDLAHFSEARNSLVVNLQTGAAVGQGNDTLFNIEGIAGGDGDDWIIGNTNDNQFYGNDGNDRLEGNDGNDQRRWR